MTDKIAILTDVDRRLATVQTVDEAKDIRDKAEAIRIYAKSAKKGLAIQNRAACIKILAERRAGELLKAVERAQGKDGKGLRVTLTQSEISEPTGRRWQTIARVPEEKIRSLEAELTETEQELTSAYIRQVAEGKPHIAQNAGESEWYTPTGILDAVRLTMGGIDCDPATHEAAQSVVQARQHFTQETDGLVQEWKGSVFLNPPYSQPLVGRFCEKLFAEIDAGRTTQAITLTNNATETVWGQSLLGRCLAVCFVAGRVKFWNPEKESFPLQGQMLCYFGRNSKAFYEQCLGLGIILRTGA
jgi:hypothetical protein